MCTRCESRPLGIGAAPGRRVTMSTLAPPLEFSASVGTSNPRKASVQLEGTLLENSREVLVVGRSGWPLRVALSWAPSVSPDRLPRTVMLVLQVPDVQFCTSRRNRPAPQPFDGEVSCSGNSHGLLTLQKPSGRPVFTHPYLQSAQTTRSIIRVARSGSSCTK